MLPPRALLASVLVLGLALLGCHEVHFDPDRQSVDIDIYDDLFAISVVSDDHAVAAGYWGSIYLTEDGGKSWVRGQTDTRQLIYDVSVAPDGRGWAVGQSGIILRTTDGGRNWISQPNPKLEAAYHLFGVHAVDGDRGWVVGAWGTRMFTDDGGLTWQDHSLTIDEAHPQFVWLDHFAQERVRRGEKVFEDVGLNDVFCLDPPETQCWIAGEFGYIFHSEDLGATWAFAAIEGGGEIEPARFGFNELELPEGYEEKLDGFIQQLLDQDHLKVSITPVASAAEIERFGDRAACRADPMGCDPTPLFEILEARSTEVRTVVEAAGLLSDRIRMRGAPPWDYEDFIESDDEFLERYFDDRTAPDPGVEVEVEQTPYLYSIRFQSVEFGLIAGLGGLMLRSEDGGQSWAYGETGRKQALFAVDIGADRAMAIGEKGFVLGSADQGRSWIAPDRGFPSIFTYMRDIGFSPDGGTGYIVGQTGMVLRSEDGGTTWSQVLPPPDRRRGGGFI
ncbi:MAG: YCF48-related protein [Myxococcota bacterium]